MSDTRRYLVHGLTVDSDLELHLPPGPDDGDTSLVLREGAWQDGPWEPADDEQMAVLHSGDELLYRAGRIPSGYRIRFETLCDFDLSADLASATWRLSPGASRGFASVLAAGALLAFRLTLAGEQVLHASAVVDGGRTIAMVAASGMGKTTMATLLCAAGATFLTDDVLRLTTAQGTSAPHAYPGSCEVRLRPAAAELADRFDGSRVRRTDDGRLALELPVHTGEPLPLAAVVVPLPDKGGEQLTIERMPAASALATLGRFPRLPGWTDRDVRRREFHHVAELVANVPVYTATIPWGPPFHLSTARELMERVGSR